MPGHCVSPMHCELVKYHQISDLLEATHSRPESRNHWNVLKNEKMGDGTLWLRFEILQGLISITIRSHKFVPNVNDIGAEGREGREW